MSIGFSILGFANSARAVEVKIGYYAGAVMTIPSWIAEAKGFYKTEGIEATLIPVANGPLMSSNTASGAIDIGYNSPSNVGLTREQGLNQTIILGNMIMPIVLLARTDVKAPNLGNYPKSIADLKGLNWGSFGRGSDIENIMRVMAKDAGLDPNTDVSWIGVGPPPTGLPALKAGRIDVYGTTMPSSEIATAAGYGKIIVDLRKGEGPGDFRSAVYSVLLALKKRVDQEPELFTKVVNAHKRAYCWAKDPKNFDEAASIIKTKMPVDALSDLQYRDLVKHALEIFTVKYPTSGLEGWNKVMVAGGILKQPMLADVVWKDAPASDPDCK
jgi:NitT/TauT family transport system substrate-binding protein